MTDSLEARSSTSIPLEPLTATSSMVEVAPPPRKLRGFAAMTAEQRKAYGSKGGKTAHERGTANKFTPETASLAGKRPHLNGTAHKWTSEEAREAGRKGGSAMRKRRGENQAPPSSGTP